MAVGMGTAEAAVGERARARRIPRPDAKSERARILLLAPVFAPQASIGARRWVGLATWLAAHGFELDVVCSPSPPGRAIEPGLLDRLPQGTRIVEVPVTPSLGSRLENAAWQRLRGWLPAGPVAVTARPRTHVLPGTGAPGDAVAQAAPATRPSVREALRTRMRAWWALQEYETGWRWAADAVATATALFGADEHRLVVTSGPPHTVAEAGVAIARARRIPFVLDLRDPWALQPHVPADVDHRLWFWLAARGEARAIAHASLVTVTSDAMRERMAARHPAAAHRIATITNGCDAEPLPEPMHGERLRIAFAGTLYLQRDPRPLFEAVALAVRRGNLTPAQLELVMMGHVGQAVRTPTRELARRAGIEDFVQLLPRGSHQAAQQLLAASQLLVILPWDNDLAIPGKLFDYARHRAWLLAFARADSGLARILQGTHADVVAPGDVEQASRVIERCLAELRAGARPRPLADDPRFSRRHQAERLVDRLRPLLAQTGAAPR